MIEHTTNDLAKVRAVLIEMASLRKKVSYSRLAQLADLDFDHKMSNDRRLFGLLLGEVAREEYSRGRPLLTALVVRKDTREPGKGFLGLEGFPKTRDFWETELKRVYDFWGWSGVSKPTG